MRKTAVIYARISRAEKDDVDGVSRQLEDCRLLAERLDLEVIQEYVENDTGASTKSRKARPKYDALLAGAKAGAFSTVLVYSNSRLTRRPREYADWIDLHKTVEVRTVASGQFDLSTADGRATASTLAIWDAAEAERIAERVARAKKQNVERGEWRGGRRPFGYEDDGVTVRPEEAKALLAAAQGLLDGRSLNALAREFGCTTTGSKAKPGRPMDAISLRRLLLRPRNAGLMEVAGQVAGPACWDAIIPEDIHHRVVALLADPTRKTTTTPNRRWLLSGIARCSVCEEVLVTHSSPGKARSYACRTRCVARSLAQVDQMVLDAMAKRLVEADLRDLLPYSEPNTVEADMAEAAEIRTELAELAEAKGKRLISVAQMVMASAGLQARLTAVEARLSVVHQSSPLSALAASYDPSAAFLASPLDVQRKVIDLLAVITIRPGRKGRPKGWRPGQPYADLESVEIAWRGAGEP